MNIEQLNFTYLDPQLEEILNNFSALFDIRIGYFLLDGSEFKIGRNRRISKYCYLLRESLGYRSKCLALDAHKQHRAKMTGETQSYVCHGGCNEAIKPIFSNDELVGYIMIGQAVSQPGIPDYIMHDAEKAGIAEELTEAFNDLPHFKKEKFTDIIQLFSELTDLVMLKNLITYKELGAVRKVMEYMKNTNHQIDLKFAARFANMSESRLRHKFKEELSLTFSQAKIGVVMEKAQKIMEDNPNYSVQETAFELGYSDPLYFSRVFKKHFGYPPSMK